MSLYSVNFLLIDLIFCTSFKCFMYVLHLIVCYSTYRINFYLFYLQFPLLNFNLIYFRMSQLLHFARFLFVVLIVKMFR